MNILEIEANIADLEARLARGERRPSMNNMHVSGGRFVRDDEIERCINLNRLALRAALEKEKLYNRSLKGENK